MSTDVDEETVLIDEETSTLESSSQTVNKKKYGILLTIIFLQFFSRAADTIIYPFFPKATADERLSMTEIGIIFSAYDFARFASSPIFGSILLQWHPKSMCTVGTLVTGLACAGLGCMKAITTQKWFLALCIVLRFTAGIGSTMITISSTSILMKASGFSSSIIIGCIETANGLSYAVGPAIGASLYDLVGYAAVFWITGGVLILALPIFLFAVPVVVEEATQKKKSFFDLLEIPGCALIFTVCMFTRINGATSNVGTPEFIITNFHKSVSFVGLLYVFWSSFHGGMSPIVAKIINKFPKWNFPMMSIGCILHGIFWFFTGPSPLLDFIFHGQKSFWLTTFMVLGQHITYSFFNIPAFPAALDLAAVNGHPRDSVHTYGMVTGLVFSGWGLGATAGPVIGGAIIDALNFAWTGTVLTFVDVGLGLLIITYLLYMRVTNQPIAPADSSTNQIPADKTDTKSQQVAEACHDRMNSCLENSTDLTKVHHQQPKDELKN